MIGKLGRIEQGLTRNEIHEANQRQEQGFATEDIDEGDDLSTERSDIS